MRCDSRMIAEMVRAALGEDVGSGDVTTQSTVHEHRWTKGAITAKEEGIIAGLDLAGEVYRQVDARIDFVSIVEDGHQARVNDVLAEVSGPARGILTAERTALNFLQRVSGIATLTYRYVHAIAGTGAKILDTRKTTPGLRSIEKYGVRVGGGRNHREGLYDQVLIKDNHVRIAGSVKQAVALCRERRGSAFVEVEARTMAEVKEAVEVGVERIMLDNMELAEMKAAVTYIRDRTRAGRDIEIEASGGIDLETVRGVAATGVDFISVGALTHSAQALDISFNLIV